MSNPNRKFRRTVRIEDVAYRVCWVLGATDEELSRVLDITVEELESLKANDADFARWVRLGQRIAEAEVTERLYRLALGFRQKVTRSYLPHGETQPVIATYDEEVPPDRTACVHWLRNRQPKLWGKVSDVEYTAANVLDEIHTKN